MSNDIWKGIREQALAVETSDQWMQKNSLLKEALRDFPTDRLIDFACRFYWKATVIESDLEAMERLKDGYKNLMEDWKRYAQWMQDYHALSKTGEEKIYKLLGREQALKERAEAHRQRFKECVQGLGPKQRTRNRTANEARIEQEYLSIIGSAANRSIGNEEMAQEIHEKFPTIAKSTIKGKLPTIKKRIRSRLK